MIFKPEDFLDMGKLIMPGDTDTGDAAAKVANARFNEWLKEQLVVYSDGDGGWSRYPFGNFAARLVAIEALNGS